MVAATFFSATVTFGVFVSDMILANDLILWLFELFDYLICGRQAAEKFFFAVGMNYFDSGA